MKPENEITGELEKSADILDDIEIKTPDFLFFKDMVQKQQEIVRCAQQRQLMLFIIVAAVLVSGIILCMGRFTVLFFAVQALAFSGAIAGLAVFFSRTRRLKDGLS
jgi:hypothetical protein